MYLMRRYSSPRKQSKLMFTYQISYRREKVGSVIRFSNEKIVNGQHKFTKLWVKLIFLNNLANFPQIKKSTKNSRRQIRQVYIGHGMQNFFLYIPFLLTFSIIFVLDFLFILIKFQNSNQILGRRELSVVEVTLELKLSTLFSVGFKAER